MDATPKPQSTSPDFLSIAKILGHEDKLKANAMEVHTQIVPKSLEHARAIMSRATDEERSQRQKIFFDKIAHRQRGPQGKHDRAFSHIFADGNIAPDDQEAVDRYLKNTTIDTVSLQDKTLAANEVWMLGKSTNPVVINIGTLTMEPGSRVEIYNSILSFTCENLVRNGSTSSTSDAKNYDFGIFGATLPSPSVGSTGGTGGLGEAGKEGTCKCSESEPGDNGTPGKQGGSGGSGSPGGRGDNGLTSLIAEITITKSLSGSSGTLSIKSQGGVGSTGGKGGKGGIGGKGGKGGNGKRCAGTCTSGGDGGVGGSGGDGGTGGIGGNGANAEDVLVTVPAEAVKRIYRITATSDAGDGGPGGDPGDGGDGGEGGDGVSHNICHGGNKGTLGKPGLLGKQGERGKHDGLAGRIIINGVG